jgi:cobalt-zinc-cadmium efflux system membrane fusion protein
MKKAERERLGITMKLYWYLSLILWIMSSAHAQDELATVSATPALMKQLKIVAVGQNEMRDSLRVPALVELDQHRVARIGASVTGRVVEIKTMLGQEVRKGELLAMLNSTELGMAQSAYLKANSQVNLHRLEAERARLLFDSGVIAAAKLQERESRLVEAEVDLRAAAQQLSVMGMEEQDIARLAKQRNIHSISPITASLSGTVIERKVTLGQVVQPADALFTIADLSRVWLVAEVPEQQAHWAREGDEASAEIAALPEHSFTGPLIYVADLVNPETRTVNIRMEIPNPDGVIKPQMLATLMIRKQGVQEMVLPDSAVVREGNRDHVFVETAPGHYQLRPVELGLRDGKVRRVISGVHLGERVVVDGAFHLNTERLRKHLE